MTPIRLHAVTPDDAPPSIIDWLRSSHVFAMEQARTASPGRERDGWTCLAAHIGFMKEERMK